MIFDVVCWFGIIECQATPQPYPDGEKISHLQGHSQSLRHTFIFYIPINGHLLFLPRSAGDFGEPHISVPAAPATYTDHSLARVPRTPRHLASSLTNLTASNTAPMDKQLKDNPPILIQNCNDVREKH